MQKEKWKIHFSLRGVCVRAASTNIAMYNKQRRNEGNMNVRNCRKCGRIFNYVGGPPVCPKCREDQEVKFQAVKKFIQENHGADINEVAEACEVEMSQIRQWIREERLQFADDSPIRIPCEGCGAMIQAGRFCDKCKAQMTQEFNHAIGRDKPKEPAKKSASSKSHEKMRFL